MAGTHYETLGVSRSATAHEIRSAYRKIVLANHPDRNPDPRALIRFREATAAYEVLNDREAKIAYDATLDRVAERAAQARAREEAARRAAKAAAEATAATAPKPKAGRSVLDADQPIAVELQRLSLMFSRGQVAAAEELAHRLTQRAPREALPYAVLADIAQSRGDRREALRLYAFAVQFEPANALYQRRYERLLNDVEVVTDVRGKVSVRNIEPVKLPGFVAWAGVAVAAFYHSLGGGDLPLFPEFALLNAFSARTLACLLFGGITLGIGLSRSRLVDRFHDVAFTSSQRLNFTVVLILIGMVNLWLAAILYAFLGMSQQAFNRTTSMLLGYVAGATAVFWILAPRVEALPTQVLVWGGNLLLLGTVLGWMATDVVQNPDA